MTLGSTIKALVYKFTEGKVALEDFHADLRTYKRLLFAIYDVKEGSAIGKRFVLKKDADKFNVEYFKKLEKSLIYQIGGFRGFTSHFWGLNILAFYEWCCNEPDALCYLMARAKEDIELYLMLPKVFPVFIWDCFNPSETLSKKNINFHCSNDCSVFSAPIDFMPGPDFFREEYCDGNLCHKITNQVGSEELKRLVSYYDECLEMVDSDKYFAIDIFCIVISFTKVLYAKSEIFNKQVYDLLYDFISLNCFDASKINTFLLATTKDRYILADNILRIYSKIKDFPELCLKKYYSKIKEEYNISDYYDYEYNEFDETLYKIECPKEYESLQTFSPLDYWDEIYQDLAERINNYYSESNFSVHKKQKYTQEIHTNLKQLLIRIENDCLPSEIKKT